MKTRSKINTIMETNNPNKNIANIDFTSENLNTFEELFLSLS